MAQGNTGDPGGASFTCGVLLALVAYGGELRLGRLTVVFFGLSCGLAGCVLALGTVLGRAVPAAKGILYTDVDLQVLLIAAGVWLLGLHPKRPEDDQDLPPYPHDGQ